jgi:DNA-directed RNA polymerase subunit RPC12/RpoP
MSERMRRIPTESATTELEWGRRTSRRSPLDDIEEPSAEERAMLRQAARVRFRTYCIACGRSSESASVAPRVSRCQHCGGTMLVEPAST